MFFSAPPPFTLVFFVPLFFTLAATLCPVFRRGVFLLDVLLDVAACSSVVVTIGVAGINLVTAGGIIIEEGVNSISVSVHALEDVKSSQVSI